MSDFRCHPNFLIVGAHKAGTTSLQAFLGNHPEIFMSNPKEPHTLIRDQLNHELNGPILNFEEYLELFSSPQAADATIRGEASVLYLPYFQEAISEIKLKLDSRPKILVSLRDPVERAYSAYLDVSTKNASENLSFGEALLAEPERRKSGEHKPTYFYRQLGEYSEAVSAFMKEFDTKVVFLDDFSTPEGLRGTLNDIAQWLGVSPFSNDVFEGNEHSRHNSGSLEWNFPVLRTAVNTIFPVTVRQSIASMAPGVHRWLSAFAKKRLMGKAPEASSGINYSLGQHYLKDVERLEKLLNRQVPWSLGGVREQSDVPR